MTTDDLDAMRCLEGEMVSVTTIDGESHVCRLKKCDEKGLLIGMSRCIGTTWKIQIAWIPYSSLSSCVYIPDALDAATGEGRH